MNFKNYLTITLFSALLLQLISCESPKEEPSHEIIRISWPEDDEVSDFDNEIPSFELNQTDFLGSGKFNGVFWIDFDGARVSEQDSFIVARANLTQAIIPAFSSDDINLDRPTDEVKREIIEELITLFPDVDIRITLDKPLSGQFSRVHVGGENFTGRPRVLGVAPLDLGNRSGSDVLFIFSREFNRRSGEASKQLLIQAIAHEIAHSLGARHIVNDQAIMHPVSLLDANSFNQSGEVVGAPEEIENSLDVLKNSAGSLSQSRLEREIPDIVDLAAFTSNGVIQYSVIARPNIISNPNINLTDYTYRWSFEGKTTEGSSVLMRFDDREDHILVLEVINEQSGASKKFSFSVGRRL